MTSNTVKRALTGFRPDPHYRPKRARERRGTLLYKTITLSLASGLLAACGSDDTFEVPEGFFGAVVAEEPRAALVARDALVAGGSAADAAVIAYFTLAATLPSSAGLTATGSCVVHDPATSSFQRLDFTARQSTDAPGGISLPIGPRAMFALHARHGVRPFEELIIEAERVARFGEPVSRALAADLSGAEKRLQADSGASRVFLRDGQPIAQGEPLVQLELAATLARLRSEGIGSLYSGQLASAWLADASRAGFDVDANRLRDALPQWTPVEGVTHANHRWGIAASTRANTRLAESTLGLILDGASWKDGDADERAHLLAEALNRATVFSATQKPIQEDEMDRAMTGYDGDRRGLSAPLAQLARSLGTDAAQHAGATAFFAIDRRGLSIGCSIGLGGAFGTGKLAPGLGILFAPAEATRESPRAASP